MTLVEDLACADQIIVACGRFEGIDARRGPALPGAMVLSSPSVTTSSTVAVAAMVLTGRSRSGRLHGQSRLARRGLLRRGSPRIPCFANLREFRSLEIPGSAGRQPRVHRALATRPCDRKTFAVRPDIAPNRCRDSLGREDRAAGRLQCTRGEGGSRRHSSPRSGMRTRSCPGARAFPGMPSRLQAVTRSLRPVKLTCSRPAINRRVPNTGRRSCPLPRRLRRSRGEGVPDECVAPERLK